MINKFTGSDHTTKLNFFSAANLKFLKNFLFLFFWLTFISTGHAQQEWVRNYNGSGSGEDKSYAITVDRQGNIYVTGNATFTGSGSDFCTIKYSPSGVQQWVRTYNGPGNSEDKAYAITVDKNCNVIVTGYSTGIGSHHDFTTIKYSSDGTQLWSARYNEAGNGDDEAHAIAVDDSGNVYVTGFISKDVTDWYTIKYRASDGQYQWGVLYNGEGNGEDKAYAITVDQMGGIFVTGYCTDVNNFTYFNTIKYNLNGIQQWVSTYNRPSNGNDKAYAITLDRAGYVYVTGWSKSVQNSYDYATIKYKNSNGDSVWVARYNGIGNSDDKAYAITVDSLNNIYVTGSSRNSTNAGSEDYLTIKYNSAGNALWTTRYQGISTDIPYALAVCQYKGVLFVTGSSRHDSTAGSEDILTVKYDISNGSQLQESRYNGPGDSSDAAYSIVVDSLANVFLAGYQYSGSGTGYDWVAMKYTRGDLIEVRTISSLVPKGYVLYQNYPNPFNPVTYIKFEVPKFSQIKITVTDIIGREVMVLVNEYMHPGTYELNFNNPLLSSGIYFCVFSADGFRDVKKMILVK